MMVKPTSPEDGQAHGLRRRAGRYRLVFAIAITVAIAIVVPLAIILSGSRGVSGSPAAGSVHDGNSGANGTVIAWNPSHQDDTGTDGWHEYAVCGDIAKQTIALLPAFTNVLCWETGMGLTSDSGAALRSECEKANAAHAQIFIAVHVNGGGGRGLAGYYYTGDSSSALYAEALLESVSASMGMTVRQVSPRSKLFVLDPANNHAPIRVLLELGDNVTDRELLTSTQGQKQLAAALAKAVKENSPSTFR
jgi:N-acetylmuramoyl-L-alanine amidase